MFAARDENEPDEFDTFGIGPGGSLKLVVQSPTLKYQTDAAVAQFFNPICTNQRRR